MITDSSGDDDVGRTVAIIVGVLAGAAILIVLLSICRKFIGNSPYFVLQIFI